MSNVRRDVPVTVNLLVYRDQSVAEVAGHADLNNGVNAPHAATFEQTGFIQVRLNQLACHRLGGDMKRTKIDLRSLKSVKVLFEGDIYDLACLLLKAYKAKEQRTAFRSRPTVHGLATRYSMLTDISTGAIIEVFNRYGLPLGATVESDEDQS